tara:strand:- start:523 stop:1146 length:624 start_codon:yes stop_codon:yes gene_type:complete
MKKILFLTTLLTVNLLIFSCGGSEDPETGVSSDIVFEQIEDHSKVLSIDDFESIGFKSVRSVKQDKLMDGMINAYYGFRKVPIKDWAGKDIVDYELRFFESHQEAIAKGEKSADLRTGENAQLRKNDASDPNATHPIAADWPELLKDARECQGNIVGSHHAGLCMSPRYAEFKIFGNVIILGQGGDLEESYEHIGFIVDALKGVIAE